tara:strand:+ start:1288 stop:2454 length:1167 start_codon:yes stop_codon:yes gene_type:complete
MKIKKLCFVIFSSANYNSIKSVIFEAKKDKQFNTQIIVGSSATRDKYGDVYNRMIKDGLKINYKIENQLGANELTSMVKTTGLAMIELSECFKKLKPDIVFTVGDRHETISTAITASYMNILVAHTMGGEITGTIDETVRHAITKLSNIHFVSNEDAKKRVIKLGENKKYVFNVGCPRNDTIKKILQKKKFNNEFKKISSLGVGDLEKLTEKDSYFVVLHHPVTTEIKVNKHSIRSIIHSINTFKLKNIIIWPNSDAGSEDISKEIRIYREKGILKNTKILKNLPIELYIPLIKNSKCFIGNSSSAIRDGSFLGIPAVNVGNRQNGRLKYSNVKNSPNDKKKIIQNIKLNFGKKFKRSNMYGNGEASKKIIKILKKLKKFSSQKQIQY